MSALFDPALLIFTVPLLVALAFGVLALVGLFDFEALDVDVDLGTEADLDVDADLDADTDASGSAGLLQLLGVGRVPLSLVLVMLCFSFGWIGLVLVSFFGEAAAGTLGSAFAASLALAAPAAIGAAVVTGPLARLLQPFFKDYGQAVGARGLVGKAGVLTTGSITDTFGTAAVTVPGRGRIEVSARADDEAHHQHLAYGDRVLLYDYDETRGVYFVAPFDEHEDV